MPKTSCPKTSSCPARAAIIVLLSALVVGSPRPASAQTAEAAPPATEAAAKERFSQAVKLFKEGKTEEALSAFRAVADATHSPNARLYVGHCLVQLHRYAEAYRAFLLTIKEAGQVGNDKYEPAREAAQAQLSALGQRVARLVISLTDVPPGLAVTVDGTSLEERELGTELVLEPGPHRIEAQAAGMAGVTRQVNVDGGEIKTITLSLHKLEAGTQKNPAPPTPSPGPAAPRATTSPGAGLRTFGLVIGGVGVAGFAVSLGTGLSAKRTYDDLNRECGAAGCADSAHRNAIDRGKSLQTAANVGLVVGAVGVATGTTLFVVGLSKRPDSGVSAAVAPGGGTVVYHGTF